MSFRNCLVSFALAVTLISSSLASAQESQVREIQNRGYLNCGVVAGLYGFSMTDSRSIYRGFDVDICHALAAAVLGDAQKVRFKQLSFQNRFDELRSGNVDLIAGNNTYTLGRETTGGLAFPAITFFGSQGFMVRKDSGLTSANGLGGARICLGQGTTTEKLVTDWARANRIQFTPLVMEASDQLLAAFFAGSCDAIVGTAALLAGTRVARGADADNYVILPEMLANEPNGPAVRNSSDDRWFRVVRWVVNSLIAAEESGITQATAVSLAANSPDPTVRRILRGQDNINQALGLSSGWAMRAIQAVGNYGEIWERNLGQGSPLKLPRGRNELGLRGGMHFSPVFAE